jgi:hypothetical protein
MGASATARVGTAVQLKKSRKKYKVPERVQTTTGTRQQRKKARKKEGREAK